MWCEPSNPEWEWEHAYWFDSPEGSIGVLRRCPECGRTCLRDSTGGVGSVRVRASVAGQRIADTEGSSALVRQQEWENVGYRNPSGHTRGGEER
jgi:hypothetical protein